MNQLRMLLIFSLLLAGAAGFAPEGRTETIQGEIKAVTPEGQSFRLNSRFGVEEILPK